MVAENPLIVKTIQAECFNPAQKFRQPTGKTCAMTGCLYD